MMFGNIAVIGDDHALFFRECREDRFNVFVFKDACAADCIDESFRTEITDTVKANVSPGEKIVFSFGYNDLKKIIKTAAERGCTHQAVSEDILKAYYLMLKAFKEKGFSVYAWGPPAAYPLNGEEKEINNAAAYFNDRLRAMCLAHGMGFASVFDEMVTDDMNTKTDCYENDKQLSGSMKPVVEKLWKEAGIL